MDTALTQCCTSPLALELCSARRVAPLSAESFVEKPTSAVATPPSVTAICSHARKVRSFAVRMQTRMRLWIQEQNDTTRKQQWS